MYIIKLNPNKGLNQYRPLKTVFGNTNRVVSSEPKQGGLTNVVQELTPRQGNEQVGGRLSMVKTKLKQIEINNPEKKLRKFIQLKL